MSSNKLNNSLSKSEVKPHFFQSQRVFISGAMWREAKQRNAKITDCVIDEKQQ